MKRLEWLTMVIHYDKMVYHLGAVMKKIGNVELVEKGDLGFSNYIAVVDENWKRLEKSNKNAKGYVGRVITHPYADGAAVYLVTEEQDKTVTIQVVNNIGDNWVLPAWGEEDVISKKTAVKLMITTMRL